MLCIYSTFSLQYIGRLGTQSNYRKDFSVTLQSHVSLQSFTNKGHEYSDLFVSDWPWGATASFLWVDMLTASLFIWCFGNIIYVTFMPPKHTAFNWQRRTRERTERETEKDLARQTQWDRHGDHNFAAVCLGFCCVFAVNSSSAISQCPPPPNAAFISPHKHLQQNREAAWNQP